ncbi:acetylglutamate kinase [Methanomassiliicoccus luminyensis]|uniref:acetylglutamate kinase n=1 Tax=Methanomassiliicoccus luminyensis TaxID=1080712 RepID=UPI000363E564|nr:acetylglutamate kinase [Methanomassiliicoccus luminyensis]
MNASSSTGKRILIKFGGNALSGEGDLKRFSEDIARLLRSGVWPIIVHGGGPEISQEMERRGLKVKKVSGLRVTDDAALQVAAEVLARINSEIVASLKGEGVDAVGMCGCDSRAVVAAKMPPVAAKDEGGRDIKVDLDRVGEVSRVDRSVLEPLVASGKVPVIFPICAGEDGGRLNVNADTVAASVARAVGADEMILVTDVPGILKGGEGGREVIPSLTLSEVDELIAGGVITGGMIPKVEACRAALGSGVSAVLMLNGKEPHSMVRKMIQHEKIGTEITVE